MATSALIATGHGYEKSERGRCEAFDPFEIIANPLGGFDPASRASRVFYSAGGKPGSGVDYGSHALYLLRRKDGRDRGLYVAVHHGAGREVWNLGTCYRIEEEAVAGLLAMPERALYSLLHSLVHALDNTRRAAIEETAAEWRKATVHKRVKVSRKPSAAAPSFLRAACKSASMPNTAWLTAMQPECVKPRAWQVCSKPAPTFWPRSSPRQARTSPRCVSGRTMPRARTWGSGRRSRP